ncbi:MAG TPA: nuclear transport factor 2 family protein, partial [Tepidisphaeraceae bacterium]
STVQQIESQKDPGALVTLFAEDATLESPAREQVLRGKKGAEVFWSEYLNAFQEIQSTFTQIKDYGEYAVLEWEGNGKLPTSRPIKYRGVSIVEFKGEKAARFVTYYDSAAFLNEGSKHTAQVA